MLDERPECSIVDFQTSDQIAPNTRRNFFGTGHPSAQGALVHTQVARERRLPLLAMEETADLSKENSAVFAHEGLQPRFIGGANPLPKHRRHNPAKPSRQVSVAGPNCGPKPDRTQQYGLK